MDHFKGINDQERHNNEMMQHMRRQTELLEQIAQLLQPKGEVDNVIHPTAGVSIDNYSKRQQGQRGSNSNSRSRQ